MHSMQKSLEAKPITKSIDTYFNQPFLPKSSMKEKHEFIYERIEFTNQDVQNLIETIVFKGNKIITLFESSKTVLERLKGDRFKKNPYLKIALRKILYDLGNHRRIGNNLKGLSKSLINEIQNQVFDLIQMEKSLIQCDQKIDEFEWIINRNVQEIATLVNNI